MTLSEIREKLNQVENGEPWLTDGAFVYELDIKGVNYWCASIQHCGPDSASEEERKMIAGFMANSKECITLLLSQNEKLKQVLSKWEAWEAEFIMNDAVWSSSSGLPSFTQEAYDSYIELQIQRNQVT